MKIYKKFSPVQTEILEEEFKKSEFYPKHRKIQNLSARFHSSYTKINNWFKYKRRKLYFLGRFSHYRLRKIFSQEENDALNMFFEQNSNPNHAEIKRISMNFPKLRVCQIRNWFSNRRRKARNDAKKMQRSKKTKEMPRKACLQKPEIKTKENLLEKNSLAPENNSHSNEKTLEIKQEYERSVQRKETEVLKKEEICVKKEEICFVKREEPKLLFSQNPFANNQTANFSNQNLPRFNMQNMNFFRSPFQNNSYESLYYSNNFAINPASQMRCNEYFNKNIYIISPMQTSFSQTNNWQLNSLCARRPNNVNNVMMPFFPT